MGKFTNGAVTAAMSYALSNLGRRNSGGQSGGEMTDEQIDEYIANNPIELNLDEAIAFQPPSLPQWFVDGATGFGDGVFNAVTFGYGDLNDVRGSLGIDGGVNQDSAAYRGARVAGNVQGGLTNVGVGLRLAAGYSAGMSAGVRGRYYWNSNRYFRVGPGRMPANGRLPSGTHVPRASIGRGPNNPHIDLRIRPFD